MKHLTNSLAALAMAVCACSTPDAIENMKCQHMESPICIDCGSPSFSWTYTEAAGTDFVEAGSLVEIALSEDKLGIENIQELSPLTSYVWRVTAWNADSSKIITSPVAHFETAMFSNDDWKGTWISDGVDKDAESAPMLRKEFDVRSGLAKARLYMSAAAYADVTINGERAFEARLEPGYTAYDKRNLYCAYDVTDLIGTGTNCIGAVLGNGFYNEIKPVATWGFENAAWRGRARMVAELHLAYSDGSKEIIATDGSWKAFSDGPWVHNNIYSGDAYDARLEIPGWNKPGFDDSAWKASTVVDAPSPLLSAQKMPSIEPVQRIAPVAVRNWGDTLYVFDFGINLAGVCELNVRGEEGTRLEVSHAEIQLEDGTMENCNIACYFNPMPDYEFQTDIYWLKGGDQDEVWRPSFTYHGFRYAEVRSDRPIKLDESSLTAIMMHTNLQSVGSFTCSNPMLNTIWEMARRTYLNNMYSIFTDCPQREKNGWTADNFLTTELGMLNFDAAPYFLNKWMGDVVDNIREDGRVSGIMPDWGWGYTDWIGPVWDASIFAIAEYAYDYTGETSHIKALWPVWKRYLEFLQTREEEDGLPTYGIGDWVYLNVATPTQFTTPCFYYKDWCVMARFASMMGEDPAPYAEKAEIVRNAINAKWFHPETNLYAEGSQAAQGIALYLGVAPEGTEQAIADNLAQSIKDNNGFLEFGSMGSKTVPRMLTKYGHLQTAFDMAAKEDSPCWGGWVKNGLTTLPETWVLRADWRDSSLDHAFLGDIAAWYVSDLAGIRAGAPGFSHIIIAPHFPEGLDDVSASYESIRGRIESSWKRSGSKITLNVFIPVGCTAELVIDGKSQQLNAGRNNLTI